MMSITLASTWLPRGEMPRLRQMYQRLLQIYERLIISVPRDIDPLGLDQIRTLTGRPNGVMVVPANQAEGRYVALRHALETTATHVHYVDMDRLLHWVETRPLEWQQTVAAVQRAECLIIGRTPRAIHTHPRALQQTEQVINVVFSHLLGQQVDLGGGSRGFSRRAVRFLMTHSSAGTWPDAQWPMLLHQAGFALDYLAVEGLEWESADQHRLQAADPDTQRRLAAAYDTDPQQWASRVQIALDIIQAGLATRFHEPKRRN